MNKSNNIPTPKSTAVQGLYDYRESLQRDLARISKTRSVLKADHGLIKSPSKKEIRRIIIQLRTLTDDIRYHLRTIRILQSVIDTVVVL